MARGEDWHDGKFVLDKQWPAPPAIIEQMAAAVEESRTVRPLHVLKHLWRCGPGRTDMTFDEIQCLLNATVSGRVAMQAGMIASLAQAYAGWVQREPWRVPSDT